ncbi:LysR family transcriptional regulator, partial [Streptomyces sp900116325]
MRGAPGRFAPGLAVARHGSLGRAARDVGITQPAA